MSDITIGQCRALLDRLAYPERYEEESGSRKWFSGDGPFEEWAWEIAEKYKAIVESPSDAGPDE